MSQLANKISDIPLPEPTRAGPRNACFPLYGTGDMDDWDKVEGLRARLQWRQLQTHIDQLLDIEEPINLEKFRYHWRRRCNCWPVDLRR